MKQNPARKKFLNRVKVRLDNIVAQLLELGELAGGLPPWERQVVVDRVEALWKFEATIREQVRELEAIDGQEGEATSFKVATALDGLDLKLRGTMGLLADAAWPGARLGRGPAGGAQPPLGKQGEEGDRSAPGGEASDWLPD